MPTRTTGLSRSAADTPALTFTRPLSVQRDTLTPNTVSPR